MNHKFCTLLLGATMLVSANAAAECFPRDLPGRWAVYVTANEFTATFGETGVLTNFYCEIVIDKNGVVRSSAISPYSDGVPPYSACRIMNEAFDEVDLMGNGQLRVTPGCAVRGVLSPFLFIRTAAMQKDKLSMHGMGLNNAHELSGFQFHAVKK